MKMFIIAAILIGVSVASSPCDKFSAQYRNIQFWLPMEANCHLYLVCVPRGTGHRPIQNTCGDKFWDQKIKTCMPNLPSTASCDVNAPPPTTQPTTTYSPSCTYEVNPNNDRQFRPRNSQYEYQSCPVTFYFSTDKCTCLPKQSNTRKCDSSCYLRYDFDYDLKDSSCSGGDGRVAVGDITFAKSMGSTVAVFNGNGYIDIQMFRNVLAGAYLSEFSISMFFRTENEHRSELLFDNGNLYHYATVLMGYKAKDNSVSVAVRISGGKVTKKFISASVKLSGSPKEWQHVAYVYNNGVLSVTSNGHTTATQRIVRAPGAKDDVYTIDNLDEPLSLGGRSDGNYYFSGMMDDIRVFKRALSMKEIQKLALGEF